MNLCSQSLPPSSTDRQNCLVVPRAEVDTTNKILTALPVEIWCKIFNCLSFQDLKLFIEHKVNVLKKPLNGEEDTHRLMMGRKFIFDKKDFLKVVKKVYSVTLCCKEFYLLTIRERNLLINAANWSRLDKKFFINDENFFINKETPRCQLDDIEKTHRALDSMMSSCKNIIPKLPLDTFSSEKLSLAKFVRLDLKPLKIYENKSLILNNIFEKIKVTDLLIDKIQITTEQARPSDSNEEWRC